MEYLTCLFFQLILLFNYVYNILLHHVIYVGLSHGLNLSNIYSYHINQSTRTIIHRSL